MRRGALSLLRSLVRTHWTAKAAAALKGPAPAPEVAELALVGQARTGALSFFQGHRTRQAKGPRIRLSTTRVSSSFGSTSHPNVRWSRGLKLCRAFVRDVSPARVLSDPPQIPAPVGAALATSQPVQQVEPIVPTDRLLFRTHWLVCETLLWQRDQNNHEPKCGNGLRGIENRWRRTLAAFLCFISAKPSRAHLHRITFILWLGGIAS